MRKRNNNDSATRAMTEQQEKVERAVLERIPSADVEFPFADRPEFTLIWDNARDGSRVHYAFTVPAAMHYDDVGFDRLVDYSCNAMLRFMDGEMTSGHVFFGPKGSGRHLKRVNDYTRCEETGL
jgi:hypothetical protein